MTGAREKEMQNWTKIFAIVAAVCMLTGCGGAGIPDRNTVSIQKDGTIRHTIVDQVQQEYYNIDIEELEALAKERISMSGSGGKIVCESVKAEGENIVVEMISSGGTARSSARKRFLPQERTVLSLFRRMQAKHWM